MDIGKNQLTYGGQTQESCFQSSKDSVDMEEYLSDAADFSAQLQDLISAINPTTFSYVQGKEDEAAAWEALLQQIDDYVEASGEQMDQRVQEELEQQWNLGQLAKDFAQSEDLFF